MHGPPPAAPVPSLGPLPDAWVAWLARGALGGRPDAELVAALVEAGLTPERAADEVTSVAGSPILAGARALLGRAAVLERTARLWQDVGTEPLLEVDRLDEDTLYLRHWLAQRPVILRGGASAWPAARWTFQDLRRRFPWAPMDVSVRRPGAWNAPREIRRMAFGDFVDVALGPPTDELYADGRTEVLDQAGLAPLRDELGLLPGLVGDGRPRAWIGPRGTVTPTHHDQSTAWQVLLVGRKRLHLASPLDPTLADTAEGLFNRVDPRRAGDGPAAWHEVELGPGDAAFVPVGWWHQVEALAPSISVSFSGFRWPNAHGWYFAGDVPRSG